MNNIFSFENYDLIIFNVIVAFEVWKAFKIQ